MSKPPLFDPQQVPVLRVDSHLPAVPAGRITPQALQSRFATPPSWQPELMRELKFLDRTPTEAAVLLGIVLREQPTVLLTQRPAHMTTHPGQIAFAGGKRDATDADAVATALREAQEEIGLHAQHVQVLGTLPQYVTGSIFHVTPVVALVSPHMQLTINTSEVAEAFEVPLAFLLDPANHRWHRHTHEGVVREWLSMPYQDGDTLRFVWGATAGMLRNFYGFLLA